MNPAYISALSALAGSAIGALASFMTTWLTQRYQERAQRIAAESTRREKLFGDFIEQSSRLFADALTHGLDDPSKLVPLYAIANRMRLFATVRTNQAADRVLTQIVEAYYAPNIDFSTHKSVKPGSFDPLRDFTETCRSELTP